MYKGDGGQAFLIVVIVLWIYPWYVNNYGKKTSHPLSWSSLSCNAQG
jgi:hypothetical protein